MLRRREGECAQACRRDERRQKHDRQREIHGCVRSLRNAFRRPSWCIKAESGTRSRMQPFGDLAQHGRRAGREIHDLRLVHAIHVPRLARRRERHSRQRGEFRGAPEPVEADIGGDDDVGRRLRDELRRETQHPAGRIDRVDAAGPLMIWSRGRSALEAEIVVHHLPEVHHEHARPAPRCPLRAVAQHLRHLTLPRGDRESACTS